MGTFSGQDIPRGTCVTTMVAPVVFEYNKKMKSKFPKMDDMIDAITLYRGLPYDSGFVFGNLFIWDSAMMLRDANNLPIPPTWWRINHHAKIPNYQD